ncbi:hypothetical protein [Pseudomonas sp.]|uniref:hypothetical protein n=1 Tax=Pseudomonas sp. TaxID=306 RepID=UPI00289E722D|nr:hypothetical protein [Pseudomonas sp.]
MDVTPENRLHFELKNVHPVAVDDYTESLQALAREYRLYLAAFESPEDSAATQMYVQEIRSGSIINELVPYAVGVLPLLDVAKSIGEYADYLKAIFDWSLGKIGSKPTLADEQNTLKNIVKIMEPTAKDQGAQMNIGVMNFHQGVTVNISLGAMEANAAQNFLHRHMAPQPKEMVTGDHHFVALKWFQTRNELKNKTGDKARIESIYPEPVKVLFGTDDLKNRMVINETNIYHKAFIVDVQVETVDGKPILYVVKALHDTLDVAS